MALQTGEVYRCPDANCGCEITVTKGAREAAKDRNNRAAAAARRWKKHRAKYRRTRQFISIAVSITGKSKK